MVRLFDLLARLDGRELPWFDKFLASPYFTSSPWPARLWVLLREAHPDYEQVDKSALFAELQPGKPYRASWINSRFSELSRLTEAFFVQQECRQEETHLWAARRAAHRRRRRYAAFERECQGQLEVLDAIKVPDGNNLAARLKIYEERYEHPEALSRSDGRKEILQLVGQIDQHFLLMKLKYMSDQLARKKTYNEEPSQLFWAPVVEAAATLREDAPLINCYYQLVRLLKEECPEAELRQLVDWFFDHAPQFPNTEQSFIIAKLTLLANEQVKKGRLSFFTLLKKLFQYGDQQQLFIQGGTLSDHTFLNICTVTSKTGDYAWTRDFIERSRPFLPPGRAEEACAMALANLLFNQGGYQSAHQLLQDIRRRRPAYQLRLHSLSVRCLLAMHLEEGRYQIALIQTVASFRRYIQRNKKFSTGFRRAYLHFAKAALRMAELRSSSSWRSPAARSRLADWITRLKPITLSPWLLEQLQKKRPE